MIYHPCDLTLRLLAITSLPVKVFFTQTLVWNIAALDSTSFNRVLINCEIDRSAFAGDGYDGVEIGNENSISKIVFFFVPMQWSLRFTFCNKDIMIN